MSAWKRVCTPQSVYTKEWRNQKGASGSSFRGVLIRTQYKKREFFFLNLTISIRFTYGGRNGMRLICLIKMIWRRILFILKGYFIVGNRNCMWFSSSAHNDNAQNGDTKNHNSSHHSNYQRKPTLFRRRRRICLVCLNVVSLRISIKIGDHNEFTLAFFQVGALNTITLCFYCNKWADWQIYQVFVHRLFDKWINEMQVILFCTAKE